MCMCIVVILVYLYLKDITLLMLDVMYVFLTIRCTVVKRICTNNMSVGVKINNVYSLVVHKIGVINMSGCNKYEWV